MLEHVRMCSSHTEGCCVACGRRVLQVEVVVLPLLVLLLLQHWRCSPRVRAT